MKMNMFPEMADPADDTDNSNGANIVDRALRIEYCVARGYEPLLDIRNFRLDIRLRVELQLELFGNCVLGRGDIPVANQRFFRWVWEHKPHRCEECLKPLRNYSAVYCSHILTRGAFPEMAHDARNINILCFEHHSCWENGDREKMRIYPGNVRDY